MINKTTIVGRLTKDVGLNKTKNGTSVVFFTVACGRNFKQDGQPDADFIDCSAWNQVAENISKYTKKGSLVAISGRIQTRMYEDKETGKNRKVTEINVEEIQFLDYRKPNENAGDAGNTENPFADFPNADESLENEFPF